jgi:hypothetical protein
LGVVAGAIFAILLVFFQGVLGKAVRSGWFFVVKLW